MHAPKREMKKPRANQLSIFGTQEKHKLKGEKKIKREFLRVGLGRKIGGVERGFGREISQRMRERAFKQLHQIWHLKKF